MNIWVAIYRSAWGVLAVLLIIGLVCIFLPKCNHLRQLQLRKGELQAENRELEAMTRDLQAKQERFGRDPAFVERIARETGMVKQGEVVFQFTNPAETEATAPPVKGPTP